MSKANPTTLCAGDDGSLVDLIELDWNDDGLTAQPGFTGLDNLLDEDCDAPPQSHSQGIRGMSWQQQQPFVGWQGNGGRPHGGMQTTDNGQQPPSMQNWHNGGPYAARRGGQWGGRGAKVDPDVYGSGLAVVPSASGGGLKRLREGGWANGGRDSQLLAGGGFNGADEGGSESSSSWGKWGQE